MNGPLIRRALRRSLDQVRYVSPVRPAAAKGLVATVYQQVERDFGMLAPPVALHSPASGPLAACWLMLRETLVVPGLAGRAAKEAVAAAVSLGNACPYCVAVHTAAVRTLLREPAVAEIAEDRLARIPDPRLRAVATWARTSGLRDHAPVSGARPGGALNPGAPHPGASSARAASPGTTASPGAPHPGAPSADAPFPAEQAPELIGVAVTFHYLNRMVNVFLGDSPLPTAVPAAAERVLMAILGRLMVSADPASTAGPAADGLLPVAELPGDLPWTCRSPRIASAFARAAAAIDRAGADAVPPRVRELVLGELAGWNGHPRGPSRSWASAAASRLAEADRPAGRLALLTAFSSYQVTEQDIEDFRRGGPDDGRPDDETLVGLTSWASFAAARRIGTWLGLSGAWLGVTGPTTPDSSRSPDRAGMSGVRRTRPQTRARDGAIAAVRSCT